MPDIIGDMLERLAELDPGITPATLDRAEYLLRADYGGLRVKVPKAPTRQKELGVRLGYLDPRTLPTRTARRVLRGR